ncbi:MAG TPA: hypothetical protein PLV82_02345 [bacterium]|nr:hypothetical protein [bacterium]
MEPLKWSTEKRHKKGTIMSEIKESEYKRMKVGDLKLWDKNPRKIQDKDFKRLKDQIIKLNVYKPLLINQDNIM